MVVDDPARTCVMNRPGGFRRSPEDMCLYARNGCRTRNCQKPSGVQLVFRILSPNRSSVDGAVSTPCAPVGLPGPRRTQHDPLVPVTRHCSAEMCSEHIELVDSRVSLKKTKEDLDRRGENRCRAVRMPWSQRPAPGVRTRRSRDVYGGPASPGYCVRGS